MFAPPPKIQIVTIKTLSVQNLKNFYEEFGMMFNQKFDALGLAYYSYEYVPVVFRISEVTNKEQETRNVSLSFRIDDIDCYQESARNKGWSMIRGPWESESLRHVMFKDPLGNEVEFHTSK